MRTSHWMNTFGAAAALACLLSASNALADPIKVLIVTGQHSHDWEESSAMMQKILEAEPGIEVDVSQTPEQGSPEHAWDGWRPEFANYHCVIIDYNRERWPEPVNRAFEEYVAGGGGAMVIHAAKNAFPGWKAYEDMVGLTNTMGHVMMRQPGNTLQSLQCIGFQVTLIRGVEWLATGECIMPLPDSFPVDEVRLRELE